MKEELKKSLNQALKSLEKEHNVILSKTKIEIKENKEKEFGDFSSNLALMLSRELSKPPKDIAEMLLKELGEKDFIDRMEIAGPGFINFFLSHASRTEILKIINKEKNKFGFSTKKKTEKDSVLIEYVSSNPTGPLHVGHGRGAAFGSVLASILKATGHQVDEEYYVNDQGRQTEILSLSVWLRYLEIFNQAGLFPNNCYQGAYIESLAKELKNNKELAIAKSLSYAEFADVIWCETNEPDLGFAKEFADEIKSKFPKKLLAYNCSPSFNWTEKFSDDELTNFQSQLSNYGYKLQFVSLAGFHSMASAMYELAINYKGGDMRAFVELQEKEIGLEKRGYTGTKHQQEVGSNYYEQVGEIILGQDSELLSEKDSTENTQF